MLRRGASACVVHRREFCGGALLASAGACVSGILPVRAVAGLQDLWQPPDPSPRAFLQRALDLSRMAVERGDGTPYGAVVVRGESIVGEGWNRTAAKLDPTAHAEIEAIQDAARRLQRRDLGGCVIYTSGGRPCPMCETACYWARLDGIYYGTGAARIIDAGAPAYPGC